MIYNKVINDVANRLEPEPYDQEPVLTAINNAIQETGIEATPMIGGSLSKNTHIGDDYDVDIFLKFPLPRRNDDITADAERIVKNAFDDYERVQASRDYYVARLDGRRHEIVPVLNITEPSEAETVVDVSPLHVAYFNDAANDTIRRDVRLVKQFIDAHHIYGAESHIGGFSGHVVDLLVLAYGSFKAVLKATKGWQPKTVIDIEEHHDTPMLTLNESKTHGPLILIDPIQPHRNAAAAVTQPAYNTFKQAASRFLDNPTTTSFHKPTIAERREKAKQHAADDHRTYDIDVSFTDDRHDIQGARLAKIKEHLVRRLTDEAFTVDNAFIHHEDTSHIIITGSPTPKGERRRITGPPTDKERHAERFRDAHETVEEEDDQLIAYEPHTYDTLENALQSMLNEAYVTERAHDTTLSQC